MKKKPDYTTYLERAQKILNFLKQKANAEYVQLGLDIQNDNLNYHTGYQIDNTLQEIAHTKYLIKVIDGREETYTWRKESGVRERIRKSYMTKTLNELEKRWSKEI